MLQSSRGNPAVGPRDARPEQPAAALCAAIVLPAITMLLVALCFGDGLQATDDLDYADAAMGLLGGELPASTFGPHHHEARLSVILPLAGIFFVAGTTDASIAILPLACSVLTASLIAWLAARLWGSRVGMAAGLLYALVPLPVSLATVCVPEPVLTFALCAATVVFTSDDRRGSRAFLVGTLVAMAYLATEMGALMLPVFLLYRLLERGLRLRDAWLVAGFLFIFGLELAFQAFVHGDAFYRFTLMGSYPVDPLGQAANEDLVYRLFEAYPVMLLYPNTTFGLFGPLLALGGFYACFRLRECSLFVLWAAVILLFYNFMSSSLTRYVALPVSSRLIAPACAPLVILSAKALADLWDWLAQSRSVALMSARGLGVVGCAAVVAVSLLSMYLNAQPSLTATAAHNARALNAFLQEEPAVTLVSDFLTTRAVCFYRGYRSSDTWQGFAAASQAPGVAGVGPTFVALNGPILHEKELTGGVWGGPLSLPPADRYALPHFQPERDAKVFTVQPAKRTLFDWLLRQSAVRSLTGDWFARFAEATSSNASLTGLRAFRWAGHEDEHAAAQIDAARRRMGRESRSAWVEPLLGPAGSPDRTW